LTKGKVIQIGLFISLIGLISYKFAPQIGSTILQPLLYQVVY